ncbi:alpha/beta fold hydrolase [Aquimarina mytili]|uniref:Alpha/beta hydrolase n=1 Tax=Aquimarina mytili TaxID=874423 RepID=A0A936ZYD0_9FLAO|nr:alpha/beta hydrolase [Aquimarina mytili]MBL0684591.1 alpha/beta hydrolase [Aquimarina mytili]
MKKIYTIFKYIVLVLGILLSISILLGYTNLGNLSHKQNPADTFVTIENEKIRVSQKGSGKDILFIHGSPGLIEDWNDIADTLAKQYRVTSFDRPGHGFSSSKEYTYHIKDNALLVEQLISQLNLKNPLIVGHSYGGSTAAYMAAHSNTNNRHYIIIDSPLYTSRSRTIYKLISTPIIGKGIALLASYTIANNQIRDGLTTIFQNTPEEKVEQLIKERQRIWSQPKVIYTKSMESLHYQEDLNAISHKYKNINASITLITGKDSLKTLRKDCERFHIEVPNSELILLDKTGHYIQFDRSQDVIEIIRSKMELN